MFLWSESRTVKSAFDLIKMTADDQAHFDAASNNGVCPSNALLFIFAPCAQKHTMQRN